MYLKLTMMQVISYLNNETTSMKLSILCFSHLFIICYNNYILHHMPYTHSKQGDILRHISNFDNQPSPYLLITLLKNIHKKLKFFNVKRFIWASYNKASYMNFLNTIITGGTSTTEVRYLLIWQFLSHFFPVI